MPCTAVSESMRWRRNSFSSTRRIFSAMRRRNSRSSSSGENGLVM